MRIHFHELLRVSLGIQRESLTVFPLFNEKAKHKQKQKSLLSFLLLLLLTYHL